jgi:hypothetical protein
MIKFFKKPYPIIIEDGYLFPSLIDLLIGVIVFAVLIIFKPSLFFDQTPHYTTANCAVFGFIAFLVAIIHTNVLPRLFPGLFNSKRWTIGLELTFQASIIFTIAIINYFVFLLVFKVEESFDVDTLIQMTLSTLAIAFIPLMIVTLILQQYNFNKMMKGSGELNTVISLSSMKEPNPILITFEGEGKNEKIELKATQIVYIESSANYCDICYIKDGQLQKSTFRASLASLQIQLKEYSSFIKTHRSYIVNVNHILSVKGNAQGYQLVVSELQERTIPVSRANVTKLNEKVKI